MRLPFFRWKRHDNLRLRKSGKYKRCKRCDFEILENRRLLSVNGYEGEPQVFQGTRGSVAAFANLGDVLVSIAEGTFRSRTAEDVHITDITHALFDVRDEYVSISVPPQSELEFSFAGVSITPSEGGFHEHGQERIECTGA